MDRYTSLADKLDTIFNALRFSKYDSISDRVDKIMDQLDDIDSNIDILVYRIGDRYGASILDRLKDIADSIDHN